MKILCAKSGIHFNCEHFSAYLHGRQTHHPIFDISQKELLQYIKKWACNEMTETDSYLYYLALLNSTELITWKTPAQKGEISKSVIANNMEYLIKTISKMNFITSPQFTAAHVNISVDNKTLETSPYWIDMWNNAANDFVKSYALAFEDDRIKERIQRRENTLERLIRDPNKKIEIIASHLAEWANDAGEFPTSNTLVSNKYIPLNEYWKDIIRSCVRDDAVFALDSKDLFELIEYCEENIDAGSIFGHQLFEFLKNAKFKKQSYNAFADIDLQGIPKFRILDADSSVEDANKLAMIDSAPLEEPKSSNYPDKISYLRAKAKWDMAKKYYLDKKNSEELEVSISNTIVPYVIPVMENIPLVTNNLLDL